MDYNWPLPIGSVVLLEGGEIPVMVFGRLQTAEEGGAPWDYSGVPYPEGNVAREFTYLFNRDQVAELLFIGYQTEREFELQEYIARYEAGGDAGKWPPEEG